MRLVPVFRDREVLGTAGSLTEEIRAAIRTSRSMVVLCSPDSARSHWVAREIELFVQTHGAARIFCLVVAGEKDLPPDELLPAPLRAGHHGKDILAADARASGDGAQSAFLKVLSGVAGLDYAGLARWQERRAARRRMAWLFSGLATGAVLASLALAATFQAAQARREAKRAEATSKYLFSVLEDFLPRSAAGIPTGLVRPLIRSNSSEEKLAVLADEPEALFQVRRFLAEAWLQLDESEQAIAMLQTNVAAGRKLLGSGHPDVFHQQWRLAAALNEAGRGADAESLQRQLIEMMENRPVGDPMKLDLLNGLANSLASQGRMAEADVVYAELYELSRRHLPAEHTGRHIYAGNHVNGLLRAGRADEALRVASETLRLSEQSGRPGNPETAFFRYQVAQAMVNLGDLESAADAYARAAADLRVSLGDEHKLTLEVAYSAVASLRELGRDEECRALGAVYFGNPLDERKVKASGRGDCPLFDFLAGEIAGKKHPR